MKTNEELLAEIQPFRSKMDDLFNGYFNELKSCPCYGRNDLPPITKGMKGIYVFYDAANKPLYVGRTDNIKSRIQHHTRPSSGSGSATYAFNRAKKLLKEGKSVEVVKKIDKMSRANLAANLQFAPLFIQEKEFLFDCYIRYIELDNDVLQAMVEPYLAVKLGTYPDEQHFVNH